MPFYIQNSLLTFIIWEIDRKIRRWGLKLLFWVEIVTALKNLRFLLNNNNLTKKLAQNHPRRTSFPDSHVQNHKVYVTKIQKDIKLMMLSKLTRNLFVYKAKRKVFLNQQHKKMMKMKKLACCRMKKFNFAFFFFFNEASRSFCLLMFSHEL